MFAEFVGPEDDLFMGTISLKDLVFIPLLNTLNILLHMHGPMHGRFDTSRHLLPPQFKPQCTRPGDRRMFTLIHLDLSTLSGCL